MGDANALGRCLSGLLEPPPTLGPDEAIDACCRAEARPRPQHRERGHQKRSPLGHRPRELRIEPEAVLDAIDAGVYTGARTDQIRRMSRHLRPPGVRFVDDGTDLAGRPPRRSFGAWGSRRAWSLSVHYQLDEVGPVVELSPRGCQELIRIVDVDREIRHIPAARDQPPGRPDVWLVGQTPPAFADPQVQSALSAVDRISADRCSDVAAPPHARSVQQLGVVLRVTQKLLGWIEPALDPV
jgi:hypothetical protein